MSAQVSLLLVFHFPVQTPMGECACPPEQVAQLYKGKETTYE